MKSIEYLLAALNNAGPLTSLVILTIAFLVVFHSITSKALRVIERLARRRGDQ